MPKCRIVFGLPAAPEALSINRHPDPSFSECHQPQKGEPYQPRIRSLEIDLVSKSSVIVSSTHAFFSKIHFSSVKTCCKQKKKDRQKEQNPNRHVLNENGAFQNPPKAKPLGREPKCMLVNNPPRAVMTPLSRVSFSARRFMAARVVGLLGGEMTDDVLVGRFQKPADGRVIKEGPPSWLSLAVNTADVWR